MHMNQLEELIANKNQTLTQNRAYVLKFSATWCKPCRNIKHICAEWGQAIGDRFVMREIDIDEELDLYSFYKKQRIIRGIPAILAWYPAPPVPTHTEYWPDDSVCSSNPIDVISFFQRVNVAVAKCNTVPKQ
jgi:thiol-disulfide isomerase/thioredoxin